MIICKLLGFFIKHFSDEYKNLWLVCERGNDARDNVYWFYKYLKENHSEINARYIIDKSSPDFEKIAKLGGFVQYRSFKHYLMYYCADCHAGTHVQPCAPDLIMHYHLATKGIRARGKHIFLQHGVIYNEMKWLHKGSLYVDMFVCGAKPEYDYISNTFGHDKDVPQYLGLCRFDNLIRAGKSDKMILVMPTWRGSDYPSGKNFVNTNYFKTFNSIINNQELDKMLCESGCKLIFYPHVEIQKDMHYFSTKSENIILADKTGYDVQELLMSCSLLITDYSSVFFDVAYLNKPAIYYQFDEQEFRKFHYQKGTFDYRKDGFGSVVEDEKSLLYEIKHCIENDFVIDECYKSRIKTYFPLHDDKNCERTMKAIQNLIKSK